MPTFFAASLRLAMLIFQNDMVGVQHLLVKLGYAVPVIRGYITIVVGPLLGVVSQIMQVIAVVIQCGTP